MYKNLSLNYLHFTGFQGSGASHGKRAADECMPFLKGGAGDEGPESLRYGPCVAGGPTLKNSVPHTKQNGKATA